MPADSDASKSYGLTAERHYYGCTTVSTGAKIPIAVEFTKSKKGLEETAMHVTRDALAVAQPIYMFGDSAYDTLDIEYRVEDRIEKHSDDIRLKRPILDETYNRRSQLERTNEVTEQCRTP